MAKKNKRADTGADTSAGDDTTLDSSAPDDGTDSEEDIDPETAPGEEPAAHDVAPATFGEQDAVASGLPTENLDYVAPTPVESASGLPMPGGVSVDRVAPGQLAEPTPVESAAGLPMPRERTQLQVATDELAEDVKLGQLRMYVLNRGLLAPGQIENATQEELEALYQKSIGNEQQPAFAPTTFVEQDAVAVAQQVLTSTSREDKIKLLVERGGIVHAQAETLTTEELNLQVRAIVLNAIASEAQQKEAAAFQVQPLSDAPYGGDPPKYFVVTKGQRYAHDGQVIEVKPGETVNDRSHDVAQLRRFGVVLHEIVAPDPAAGVL